MRRRRRNRMLVVSLLATAMALASSVAGFLTPLGPAAAEAQTAPTRANRYFPETGHNLQEPFHSRWVAGGGEAVLGIPLSEERYVEGSGSIQQTFEGLTLVYDPTLQAPWDVQAQHLPEATRNEIAAQSARQQVRACPSSANRCRFFSETGHTVSGRLADFWNSHGDLPILGLPLSEPFTDREANSTVQLFERVVLEDPGSGDVRVRPLGAELSEEQGLLADLAFQPAPPTAGTTSLVNASDGLRLRAGPSLDAETIVVLPDSAEFIAAPGNHQDWIPGYADGYAGWVSADYLKEPPALPTLSADDWNPTVWQGAALSETNVRAEPTTKSSVVDELVYGDPVTVTAWVKGEEVFQGADLWARLGSGGYIYARNIGRNAPVLPPPLPPDAPASGKWIDVNLTQQIMVAYEGRTAVRVVETTTGMAGWETPPGVYQILSRVANETMTSGAIGAEHYYKLDDVLFTQYFSNRGHAIHFAWWRTAETIGRPGSHGCLNLLLDDARFFWDWATIGTPIYVHP